MNTKINYLYRDADNYKKFNEYVVEGTLTDEQIDQIRGTLNDGEYFIPRQVGMPEERIDDNITDADHVWFEFGDIEKTDAPSTDGRTAKELYEAFMRDEGHWYDVVYYNKLFKAV